MTLNLPARLERTADEHPDSPALILGGERLTLSLYTHLTLPTNREV